MLADTRNFGGFFNVPPTFEIALPLVSPSRARSSAATGLSGEPVRLGDRGVLGRRPVEAEQRPLAGL